MHFFQKQQKGFSAAVRARTPRALCELLSKLYGDVGAELNANLEDPSMRITVSSIVATPGGAAGQQAVERFFVQNALAVLSVRASKEGKIEAFLLPKAQMQLIPQSEYPSRLRFQLACKEGPSGASWVMDEHVPSESDVKLLVLASVNDLLKYSDPKLSDKQMRLRAGEMSLTTGLRDIMLEKSQLVGDLLVQQELLQAAVARDLHDTVLANLLFLRRELAAGKDYSRQEICQALDTMAHEVRAFCEDYSSRDLKDWGLSHALALLVERQQERSGVEINLERPQRALQLPPEAALHMYRIVQESINNALKHAQASAINVRLATGQNELTLEIQDNGIGLPVPHAVLRKEHRGFGLGLLQERTDVLTGMGYPARLAIYSGDGCTVVLRVDISQAEI